MEQKQMTNTQLFESLVEFMQFQFDGVNQRLDNLEMRVTGLEKRMDRLEIRMDSLETKFIGLEHRVSRIESELLVIKESIKALDERTKQDSDALMYEIVDLKGRVSILEQRITLSCGFLPA